MTKRLDPEEKRKRGILNRMAMMGRMGDYLTLCLNDAERAEANALLEKMRNDYLKRNKGRLPNA